MLPSAMEEFEPFQPSQTQETPPRRPEKVPVESESGPVPVEKMRKQRQSQSSEKPVDRHRASDSAAPKRRSTDAGDAGISGLDRFKAKNMGSRPSQLRDDMDVMRRSSSISQEEASYIRRETDELRAKLEDAETRARQAERAADSIAHSLKKLKKETTVRNNESTESSDHKIAERDAKIALLEAELDESRSHIFGLQPYRRELTREEVGREFDDLFDNVSDWVNKNVEPILDDSARLEEVLAFAKKRPDSAIKIRKMMYKSADLANGSMFPETDADLLVAVIMRFLQENIFQKILYGAEPSLVRFLTFIESSMTTNAEPKRDLFAVRTWLAEGYNAIMCSPTFQEPRQARIRELSSDLASVLQLFNRGKDLADFSFSLQKVVIEPAVAFHEKLLTSTHHFYLDIDPYIMWNHRQERPELETSPDFLNHLDKLKCEDILDNRKQFTRLKLDPNLTREEVLKQLVNVVTICPGLYLRQVGKGGAIKEPIVVRQQHMLVAWGSEEKRDLFITSKKPTLMSHLYYLQSGKQRSPETTWAQFRNIAWAY